jgi:ferredoxin
MANTKKNAAISDECVACGCCVKVCSLNAITVYKGMYAVVNEEKCVGCGKCANACPAAVISIMIKNND